MTTEQGKRTQTFKESERKKRKKRESLTHFFLHLNETLMEPHTIRWVVCLTFLCELILCNMSSLSLFDDQLNYLIRFLSWSSRALNQLANNRWKRIFLATHLKSSSNQIEVVNKTHTDTHSSRKIDFGKRAAGEKAVNFTQNCDSILNMFVLNLFRFIPFLFHLNVRSSHSIELEKKLHSGSSE